MRKLIRKLLGKLNIAITLFLAVLMTGGLGGVIYVLAGNTSTQEASTAQATTISILRKVTADTAITTITFPQGAPGATSSVPYNDVDGTGDPQFLSSTSSEPVVRLKNGSGGSLLTWLSITSWTNGVAAAEDYELVLTTATSTTAVAQVLSSNGNAATVNTGVTIPTTEYRALYLELGLSSLAGKTGTSTLSVLGETP